MVDPDTPVAIASDAPAYGSGAVIASNAGLTLAGSVLGAALGMGNEVFAAHFLGVETYGAYGLALAMAKIGEIVALFGLPLTIMHFLPSHLSQLQARLASGVIVGGMGLPLALALGFALAAGLDNDWLATTLFKLPQAGGYIAILACAIPLTVMSELLGTTARGMGHFLPSVVIRNVLPPLCYMASLSVLSAYASPKLGAAYAYTATSGLGAAVGLVWVARLVRLRIGFARPELRLRSMYRFAIPIAVNSMVTIVFLWADLFLLAVFADSRAVGVYRGCTQILLVFDLVLTACSVATAPVYAAPAADRHSHWQQTVKAATRISTVLCTPLALAVILDARDILGLLGADFAVGGMALAIMAAGQFVKVVLGSAGIALIICGKPWVEASNMMLTACLNVSLNLALIPWFGLMGAAVATAISLAVLSVLRMWRAWSVLGLRVLDTLVVRVLLVSVPLAVLVRAGSSALAMGPGTGTLNLALRLAVTGLLLAAGLWTICLSRSDRAAVIGVVLRQPMPVVVP